MESSTQVNVSNPSASKTATSIESATTSSASPISRAALGWPIAPAVGAFLLVSLGAVASFAEAIDPKGQSVAARSSQLEQRLRVLESDESAKYVAGALEQARRALEQARGADVARSRRAQSIADAALVLADRQLARRRAQAALLQTERRLRQVRERADAQRRVLEALMRERAALSQAESP